MWLLTYFVPLKRNCIPVMSMSIDSQFGFRKNRSTEMAIVHVVNKILDAIENKKLSIGIFFWTCQKPLTRLTNDILIWKLDHYGINYGLNIIFVTESNLFIIILPFPWINIFHLVYLKVLYWAPYYFLFILM